MSDKVCVQAIKLKNVNSKLFLSNSKKDTQVKSNNVIKPKFKSRFGSLAHKNNENNNNNEVKKPTKIFYFGKH